MLGKIMGNMLVKPGQAPLFDNPKNYNLVHENVSFTAQDGTKLSGWLIKGNSDKVIIQSHFGTFCCRAGYTNKGKGLMKSYPEDIHFLNQAKYLNEAGYTVLMYDFRGHGESDTGPKEMITWGPEEAQDVVSAVDYISNHPDYSSANIGLLSICMGQGATIQAFGTLGLGDYKNIKTMISVQPLDYPHFLDAMKLPGFIRRSADKYLENKTGIDYEHSSWRPYVKEITVPTLVIQNRNDGYLDEEFVNEVFEDIPTEKEMLWIEAPKHKSSTTNRLAAYDWIGKNPEPVLDWFNKYLQ